MSSRAPSATLPKITCNEKKHSHAQIAFLLGFSDQSNFSRAFKRWTSMSPKQFQDRAEHQ